MFESDVAVYFQGLDDDLERLPMRAVKRSVEPSNEVARKLIHLRDYQQEAFDHCVVDLDNNRSSLIVLATGLGKTILFCKLVEHWEGRVLVLAHLEELLQNARDDLMAITGEKVGIERAKDHHEGERIVVGLIQSVSKRLKSFRPNHFSLIIVDEAHHAASEAYRRVLEYFGAAKVVGLTATDSRADGEPLPFEVCSYRMGIREGVDQSYLVPIRGKRVIIEDINLSRVKRKADGEGDFDDSALDDEMVKGASAIADVIYNKHSFDKGILFFPGCASAKLTAELLNEREEGCAVYIDGEITGDERRELVRKLRDGEASWLCNVGIATEGFNWPEASVVGMCCPTLSRPAYVQRAGRGTRPLAGLLNGLSTSEARQRAIATSEKPHMLILDFVGASVSLDLISHESFLEEPAPKKEKVEEEDSFIDEAEEFEEPEDTFAAPNLNLQALAKGIRSKTTHSYEEFNPFEVSGSAEPFFALTGSELGKEPSISHAQLRQLSKFGVSDESLTKAEAQKLIGYVAQNGWRLWAPQIAVLKKLYNEIINARKIVNLPTEEDSFI